MTDYLALYAALLSTFVFFWNVSRATPKVKVKICFGIDKIEGEYVSGVYIQVLNPSASEVHLNNIQILYPYSKYSYWQLVSFVLRHRRIPWHRGWVHSSLSNYEIDDGCPLSLEPGKSHNILVPKCTLDEVFEDAVSREIMAVTQDQLDRKKYSSPFKVGFFGHEDESSEI